MINITNSIKILDRAKIVIPSATQTFSKGPNQWIRGVSPHYLSHGKGAWVWDVDDNKYLDYLMALGPIILGYSNPRVNHAVIKQVQDGGSFSQMHPLEVIVAEMLVDLIPCAEMVRFAKNGSDATTGAIRAARAYTRREHVAFCGYHGWHDWYIGKTTRDKGVPQAVSDLTHSFIYNDITSLESIFSERSLAAVIMEPVGVEAPKQGFLQKVKEICNQHGTVLIFDEIVTGFRFDLSGAQELFGVYPDIACFGKAMANGFPLSAVVGRKDIMMEFDEIFFSGTFGGDAIALAACEATILEMQERDVIKHNWAIGQKLMRGLSDLIAQNNLSEFIEISGYPVRSIMAFPNCSEETARLRRSFIMQECVLRGLLYFCSHIPCYAHQESELQFTFDVFQQVLPFFLQGIREGDMSSKMRGKVVEPIFRKA